MKVKCKKCGGTNIHIRAWVDANTYEYVGDTEDGDFWCDDCNEFVDVEFISDEEE